MFLNCQAKIKLWSMVNSELIPKSICRNHRAKYCIVYRYAVFSWHCCHSCDATAVTIPRDNMRNSVHDQLLILVHVPFVTKIFCIIRYWIEMDSVALLTSNSNITK